MSGAGVFPAGARREWIACRAIAMHALQRRRAQGSLGLTWLLLVLALAAGVGALLAKEKAVLVLAFGVGVPLGMLCLMWWVMWFTSIVNQCNPLAMHLLPAMRERARRVTVALWAMITLAMTLVVGVPVGYAGQVAVLTGLGLMEISATFNVWRIGALVAANWLLRHSGAEVNDMYVAFLGSDAAVAVGMLLMVLNGRVALRRMFGGPRRLPTAAPARTDAVPPVVQRLTRIFSIIAGDHTDRQPLVFRVLGPGMAGSGRLAFVLLAAVCVGMRGWIALRGLGTAHDELLVTRAAVLIAMLLALELLVFRMLGNLARRPSEQALVRLTPAAPSAAVFNQALGRYLVTQSGTLWASVSVLSVAALLALGATAGEALRAAALCCLVLCLVAVPLADYACRRENGPVARLAQTVLSGGVAGGAIAAVNGAGSAAQWTSAALAAVVLAGLLAWYRWRAMVQAPPAFPAGRFN